MGGHGGLNILPQKKWNVYNWDNRQIVEKDKKLHQEKLRKEYQLSREVSLQNKMEVLKSQNGCLPQYCQNQPKPVHSLISQEMRKIVDQDKHVNLFEEQERILMNREAEELKRLKEEEFLKDKNMDFSTRFMGTYNNQKNIPWYSKKKGTTIEKPRNKHYKPLDDVIYGIKTQSRITKQVIEAQKREGLKAKQEQNRDRTREKDFKKYQEFEDRRTRFDKRQSLPTKEILKHEEDLLLREYKTDKEEEMEKLRRKRLRRQEKQRKRIEELRRKREN